MTLLKPTVKRDLSLFSVLAWQKGYHYYLKQKLGWRYQIYFHYNGRHVNFYHKDSDFRYFKEVLTGQLIEETALFERLNRQFQRDVVQLKLLAQDIEEKNLSVIFNLIGRIMALYMFIVSDSFVNAVPKAWESRLLSQEILYEVDQKVEELVKKYLAKAALPLSFAHWVTFKEIQQLVQDRLIEERKLAPRQQYILFNERIITDKSFADFCKEAELENPEDTDLQRVSEVKGAVACQGKITGRAKIIHAARHLAKIEEGDILVAVMTNANYTPAFSKAAAIVTDEGGITCHAALIARELKKPCVTGTKIATKIFHDGDLLTVDAISGIISRI